MSDAAAKFEELLARVAISLVLLNGIAHRLPGEAVLELEREDRKAVDEKPDVQRTLGFVAAVAKLADDSETVLLEALPGLLVLGRGGAVEQIHMVGMVLDAVAQYVDDAVFGDLLLQPGKEFALCWPICVQHQRLGRFWLGVA